MKSKKLLLLYAVALTIVLATMVRIRNSRPVPLPTRDYPEIAEEGILRLVTEYNKEGYFISGDTIEGFHYELSQVISELSGLEVRLQLEMSLPESFRALNGNHTDIIARNIPVTSENKEEYLFTVPVIFNKQVLVQRKAGYNEGAEPIRNQLELGGKTIHVPKNSPALLRLANLAEEIGDSIYVEEDPLYSTEQLLILVAKGEIDYAVCDQQTSLKYTGQLPEIDIETDISFTQLQSWAVRKSSPILRDSLNSWFHQIRENGSYDLIYKRYYK
ncbi:MAG: transporter substrate-binding domain-containing protein [Tannerellaceae bacterium]|nr:transporter substrate-binding domain-containing protein [Tannerellaceae bacterium]